VIPCEQTFGNTLFNRSGLTKGKLSAHWKSFGPLLRGLTLPPVLGRIGRCVHLVLIRVNVCLLHIPFSLAISYPFARIPSVVDIVGIRAAIFCLISYALPFYHLCSGKYRLPGTFALWCVDLLRQWDAHLRHLLNRLHRFYLKIERESLWMEYFVS